MTRSGSPSGSALCGCELISSSRPARHSACAAAGSACSRTRAYKAAVARRQSASCKAVTGSMTMTVPGRRGAGAGGQRSRGGAHRAARAGVLDEPARRGRRRRR